MSLTKGTFYKEKAFFIHHLATDFNYSGIGKDLIYFAREQAKIYHKKYLRLDCFKSNSKLNHYYQELGFELRGSGKEGGYDYNLWEMKIIKE